MANTLKLGAGKWATGKDTVLSFNDENGNFKPLPFSFSRASSATVVNQSGLIETVGSGEPRIDFSDNTEGALLLEPSRTNSIFKSDDVLSTYQSQSGNVSDASESIDGFDNSIQVEYNASNSLIYKRDFTPTIGTKYTISCFVQMNDNSAPIHTVDANSGDFCLINNNTVVSASDIKTERLASTNVYRVSATKTASDTNNRFGIIKYSTQSSKGFKVTGFQLEVGSYATSYIPTSGSAVTRVAESCYQGGLLDKGVLNNTAMTLYFETDINSDTSTNYLEIISLYNNSNNIGLRLETRTNNQLYVQQSGVVNSGDNFNSFSLGVNSVNLKKIAIYLTTTQFKVFADGNKIYSTYNGTYVLSFNNISFRQNNGSVETKIQNKEIKLYNTALTDQELIALTTI